MRDIDQGNWGHAFFAGTNAALCAYAIVAFIGLRHSAIDIWMSVLSRLYRSEKPVRYRIAKRRKPAVSTQPAFDWAAVLHHGSLDDATRSRPIAAPLEQAASVHRSARRPHQAPAVHALSTESKNVRNEALARSLAQYFEALGHDDEVILRLDGPTVTITVQPGQSVSSAQSTPNP